MGHRESTQPAMKPLQDWMAVIRNAMSRSQDAAGKDGPILFCGFQKPPVLSSCVRHILRAHEHDGCYAPTVSQCKPAPLATDCCAYPKDVLQSFQRHTSTDLYLTNQQARAILQQDIKNLAITVSCLSSPPWCTRRSTTP